MSRHACCLGLHGNQEAARAATGVQLCRGALLYRLCAAHPRMLALWPQVMPLVAGCQEQARQLRPLVEALGRKEVRRNNPGPPLPPRHGSCSPEPEPSACRAFVLHGQPLHVPALPAPAVCALQVKCVFGGRSDSAALSSHCGVLVCTPEIAQSM